MDAHSQTTFLSLGLDIGTTTTHLVISRLTMGAGEDPFGRHHVLDKAIVHRSGIYLTPMCNGEGSLIDADRIHDLVTAEYARAGIRMQDVLTGAVIITGETALRCNAEQVVQRLAGESSSFAAAVAGANQESILAGRGSGAAEHSRRHRNCVLNVDIGGGTTNLAWFQQGRPVAAAAVRVGGRHLVANKHPSSFAVVSATARRVLGHTEADQGLTMRWIDECVRVCELAMRGDFAPIPEPFIVTRPAAPPPLADLVFFSGGVADLMSTMERNEPVFVPLAACPPVKTRAGKLPVAQAGAGKLPVAQTPVPDGFGDTGLLLARALLDSLGTREWTVEYPAEPIRATVIGAGQFSMSFSGETLWVDYSLLPLRNLPVLRLPGDLRQLTDAAAIAEALAREHQLRSLEPNQVAAIALPSLRQADWDTVVRFAGQLADAADRVSLVSPWVFTMRDNFGRLLGRTLAEGRPGRPLIVIDEIDTGDADYIDIGRPVERFRTVIPVVAKSLVFEI